MHFTCSSKYIVPNTALAHKPMPFYLGHYNSWLCPWGRSQGKHSNKSKLIFQDEDHLSYLTEHILTHQGHLNPKQYVCMCPFPFLCKYLHIGLHLLKDDQTTRGQGQIQETDYSLPQENTASVSLHSTTYVLSAACIVCAATLTWLGGSEQRTILQPGLGGATAEAVASCSHLQKLKVPGDKRLLDFKIFLTCAAKILHAFCMLPGYLDSLSEFLFTAIVFSFKNAFSKPCS